MTAQPLWFEDTSAPGRCRHTECGLPLWPIVMTETAAEANDGLLEIVEYRNDGRVLALLDAHPCCAYEIGRMGRDRCGPCVVSVERARRPGRR